jgi:23S rRNA (uridine2552-2'-O)-methyltransferase
MGKTRKGLRYNPKDEYYHKAKKEGFVARSIFKLEEIDQKFKLLHKNMKVLDLGCAPGSWMQYSARKVGVGGKVIGIDIAPVRVEMPQVEFHLADLFEVSGDEEYLLNSAPFDIIQSDVMAKTSGVPDADCARSLNLVEKGFWLAQKGLLKVDGSFVAKVFEGPGFTEFYTDFKKHFKKAAVQRPKAIRQGSREVYVVGVGFK